MNAINLCEKVVLFREKSMKLAINSLKSFVEKLSYFNYWLYSSAVDVVVVVKIYQRNLSERFPLKIPTQIFHHWLKWNYFRTLDFLSQLLCTQSPHQIKHENERMLFVPCRRKQFRWNPDMIVAIHTTY